MPRLARLDITGLLQHVIVRGIERRDIFNDDHGMKIIFLNRLRTYIKSQNYPNENRDAAMQ